MNTANKHNLLDTLKHHYSGVINQEKFKFVEECDFLTASKCRDLHTLLQNVTEVEHIYTKILPDFDRIRLPHILNTL